MFSTSPIFLFSARDQIISFRKGVPYHAISQFCAGALRSAEQKKDAEAPQGLIVAQRDSDIEELAGRFRRRSGQGHRTAKFRLLTLGRDLSPREEALRLQQEPDFIAGTASRIIDHIRRGNIISDQVGLMVFLESEEQLADGYWNDSEYILTRLNSSAIKYIFAERFSDNLYRIMPHLHRPRSLGFQEWLDEQQENRMAKSNYQIDADQIKDQIDSMIRDIHESEDPAELDEYRRLFKKHVSVFKRGYAAAYMLKYMKERKRSSRRRRSEAAPTAVGSSDMTSMFIGIGRTRRVYPRDLVGLILDNTKLQREDIGNIKILDNYSFADINPAKTDALISALNGTEYRGRTLNVNYAKKKN